MNCEHCGSRSGALRRLTLQDRTTTDTTCCLACLSRIIGELDPVRVEILRHTLDACEGCAGLSRPTSSYSVIRTDAQGIARRSIRALCPVCAKAWRSEASAMYRCSRPVVVGSLLAVSAMGDRT